MLITYLSIYLIFIITISLLISLLVLKLKLPTPKVLIPILIVLILLPAIGGYLYVYYFNSIPEVVVPDLRGTPLEDALEGLKSLDLKGIHAGSLFDMELPEGTIVSQRPEAGRRVKVGRMVNLLTSSGKRKVIVPNLLGRTIIQAETVLTAKGLLVGKIQIDFVPELSAGIILTQNPLPEEEVEAGSSIDITVSSTEEGLRQVQGQEQGTSEVKEEGGWFWPW